MKQGSIADNSTKRTAVHDALAESESPTLVSSVEPPAATADERLPVERRQTIRDTWLAAMLFLVLAALTTWPRLIDASTSTFPTKD